MASRNRNAYCSFCRKNYRDVGPLVEGPGEVYICGECIELCQSIIEQEKRRRNPPPVVERRLDQYVSGHEEARQLLAAVARRHAAQPQARSHVLLVGPSRGSMVFLSRALAHVLDVPFAHGEVNELVPVGPDAQPGEHPLLKLLTAADFDAEAAQGGVVYLDGADQPGVPQPLLELLDGASADLPHGLPMDTTQILFICGGRFAGLDEVLARRGRHPEQPLTGEDLVAFGMSAELVRRLPVLVRLGPLEEETLVRVVSAVDLKALAGENAAP
jgi:ATP-dependent Clp protease ATP-binding subunit ClpX